MARGDGNVQDRTVDQLLDFAEQATTPRRWRLAFALTVALFFLWGVANNLNDILIAHFKAVFTLSDLGAGLIQSAFYLGYFCLAIPAALFMRARGYRAAVIVGLLLYGFGALLFWPAASLLSYPFFLCALFIIAAGLAFLETSANPLVARMGPDETASQRLSFAQAFNPLGSISGVLIGRNFILSGASDGTAILTDQQRAFQASSVQLPYLLIGLGVIAWALLILATPFPPVATVREGEDGLTEPGVFQALLRTPRLMSGVLAQLFYVGAQVGIWSFLIRYSQVSVPGTSARTGATYLTVSLGLFMVGRFAGAALMKLIRPLALLASFAGICGALCLLSVFVQGQMGIWALVLSSFFMSVMYPTIFAESVAGLGERTKPASALLVMAIIGGAIVPAVMGRVSDVSHSIATAMSVPALCFAVVLGFGVANRNRRA